MLKKWITKSADQLPLARASYLSKNSPNVAKSEQPADRLR